MTEPPSTHPAYPRLVGLPSGRYQHAAHGESLIAMTPCAKTAAIVGDGAALPFCPDCATALASICDANSPHNRHRRHPYPDQGICPGIPEHARHAVEQPAP
ncbi:hypothetical protein [Streptomyces luteireticuli]|uniref:hypothetical protein n=1 Tax=Streptomyces luteireticuli TaxID=173858 RepID=UPI003557495B